MGMLFGPVVTGLANGLGDIIKCVLKPQGPYFFGYTFNAMLAGVIYGVFLYGKKPTLLRVVATKATINIVINAFLATLWMALLGGNGLLCHDPGAGHQEPHHDPHRVGDPLCGAQRRFPGTAPGRLL